MALPKLYDTTLPGEGPEFIRQAIRAMIAPRSTYKEGDTTLALDPYLKHRFQGGAIRNTGGVELGGLGGARATALPTEKSVGAQRWHWIQEKALAPMQWAERVAAQALYRTIEKTTPGMTPEAIALRVGEAVRETQNPSSPLDQSAFHQSFRREPWKAVFFPFSADSAKTRDWILNSWLKNVRDHGKPGGGRPILFARTVAMAALSVLGLGAAVNWGWHKVRRPDDDPRKAQSWPAYLGNVASQALENTLGSAVGTGLQALRTGYGSVMGGRADNTTAATRAISDIGRAGGELQGAMTEADEKKKLDKWEAAGVSLITALGELVGVPGASMAGDVAHGVGESLHSPDDVEMLKREAYLLRKQGDAAPPEERARLRAMDGYLGRIAEVDKMRERGSIDQAKADAVKQGLLLSAHTWQPKPADLVDEKIGPEEQKLRDEAALLRMNVPPGDLAGLAKVLTHEQRSRLAKLESTIEQINGYRSRVRGGKLTKDQADERIKTAVERRGGSQ